MELFYCLIVHASNSAAYPEGGIKASKLYGTIYKIKRDFKKKGMKNMKKLLFLMSGLLFMILVIPGRVCASSSSEIKTYKRVYVYATVPENMEEDIYITFQDPETEISFNAFLTKSDEYEYSGVTNVFGGRTYNAYIAYDQKGDWSCDLEKQYAIPDDEGEITIEFTVYDNKNAEEPAKVNPEEPASNPQNEKADILNGEKAIQDFIDKISFIIDEKNYEIILNMFRDDVMIQNTFMKEHENNTEERWNSMTYFDRFVWYKACLMPNLYFKLNAANVGTNEYTFKDYINNALDTEKALFDLYDFPREEEVYNALVEMCEFHYNYFLQTGMIYDYFNGSETYVEKEIDTEESELDKLREEISKELTGEEKKEIESAMKQQPSMENPSNKGDALDKVIIVIFLIIILVIVGIVFMVVKKQNK